jgi:hypothetical protein
MNEPLYQHDCVACVFIERAVLRQNHIDCPVDVYMCLQGGSPTAVARYSDEPADYTSKPMALWGTTRNRIAQAIAWEIV